MCVPLASIFSIHQLTYRTLESDTNATHPFSKILQHPQLLLTQVLTTWLPLVGTYVRTYIPMFMALYTTHASYGMLVIFDYPCSGSLLVEISVGSRMCIGPSKNRHLQYLYIHILVSVSMIELLFHCIYNIVCNVQ